MSSDQTSTSSPESVPADQGDGVVAVDDAMHPDNTFDTVSCELHARVTLTISRTEKESAPVRSTIVQTLTDVPSVVRVTIEASKNITEEDTQYIQATVRVVFRVGTDDCDTALDVAEEQLTNMWRIMSVPRFEVVVPPFLVPAE